MNGMKKISYLVLLVFASMLVALFGIEKDIYDALDVEGGEAQLTIPKINSIPTLSRKLLTIGDYNGSYGYGSGDDYNDDTSSGLGSGSSSDSGLGWGSGSNSGSNTGSGSNSGSTARVGSGDETCSKENVLVYQRPTTPLSNGIPAYAVSIDNVCVSESCSISNIHLSCGWFSSANLIDPTVFRRLGYGDCLVNDGAPLNAGESIIFTYSNTYPYPLSVSSIVC